MNAVLFRPVIFFVILISVVTGHCQGFLPLKLEKEVFLFQVDSIESRDNPAAGSQFLMHLGRSVYVYQVIGSDRVIQGKYRYIRQLAKNGIEVGLMASEEMFEEGAVTYEMVLLPDDETVGMYLFKQNAGPLKHDSHLTSGRYTRVTRLFEGSIKKRGDGQMGSNRENAE